jgi:dTDP-4-dehydrorhamnose 3,5-epimerase
MSDDYYNEAATTYQTGDDFITPTELKDVFIIERPVFSDDRGFFRETFRKNDLEARLGTKLEFVQANHSRSPKNSLRGIHAAPWNKLVTCIHGKVQQVVSDLRTDSPTFGKYVSVILGEGNLRSVFVPAGTGNSFLVLSEEADYSYVTTDYWAPGKEISMAWDDADLNIQWQSDNPMLSSKDQANPTLRQTFPEKFHD